MKKWKALPTNKLGLEDSMAWLSFELFIKIHCDNPYIKIESGMKSCSNIENVFVYSTWFDLERDVRVIVSLLVGTGILTLIYDETDRLSGSPEWETW